LESRFPEEDQIEDLLLRLNETLPAVPEDEVLEDAPEDTPVEAQDEVLQDAPVEAQEAKPEE
jgi:hypothetical protein